MFRLVLKFLIEIDTKIQYKIDPMTKKKLQILEKCSLTTTRTAIVNLRTAETLGQNMWRKLVYSKQNSKAINFLKCTLE